MDARPGCVTGLGALAAVLTLTVVSATVLYSGQGVFSPGALSAKAAASSLGGVRSHAELKRACGACHIAPWDSQTMADRCLVCHVDVGTQIRARDGLHGVLAVEVPGPTCGACHPEHNGPGGVLTRIDEARFPHDATGFSLRSHAKQTDGRPFACKDCHPRGAMEFGEVTCIECHVRVDVSFMSGHLAKWGRVCLPCHDGAGSNGADFSHNKLPFKLEGKHASVACEKCHANARSAKELQATPRDCLSCHRKDDKHQGAYGADCSACHTAAGWANATFDHKVFPINHGGDRQKATCRTCHPKDIKVYTCYGCHEHTPAGVAKDHAGEVPASEDINNCIKCHKGGRKEGD